MMMARGNGDWGKEGDEGWFKRVNTSQLRSRRTLLGHWSDRDALHSFSSPYPHSISLLAWFSWCPFFNSALPSFRICDSGQKERIERIWIKRSLAGPMYYIFANLCVLEFFNRRIKSKFCKTH
ncbi:hypothetical protein ACS0PU_009004 [Formica fusca]